MLLRHTIDEVKERKALTINPAKTCQPVGAMYASLGLHGCLPHSHGSQGCCSYHRSALTRHYKEPVMSGTSSFTEGSSVFGGQSNLIQAFNNMFTVYDPDIIAVHTTCLSETIGDDVSQIAQKAIDDGKVPEGKYIVQASTPSYVGSHVTGFANMCTSIAKTFPEVSEDKLNFVNILPGWVEPSDMKELKRIMGIMHVPFVMFPDTSGVMDAPQTGKHNFFPKGGTKIPDLKRAGSAAYTFALGKFCSEDAGLALKKKCDVEFETFDIPLGLKATDRFLMKLSEVTGCPVPEELEDERGQLVDMITDMEQYLYGKKIAMYGDPDNLIPLTEFLVDIGMKPVHIVTGTPGKYFTEKMASLVPDANFKNGPQADMYLMHQWIKNEPVDLLIGNSYGKYIAKDENIPFVRMGFPIYDRVGHSYFPLVGYRGALRLVEKILSVIMDKIDAESTEEKFELVM
ncbi:nitrogenase molybdenum-iron protein subunit beta [Thiospirochaeta perfilievii]|uniref:Nitrogenase molybdenum-iron protein beta chain n=1 Tax=Thiospirochaeta perfilievii TaxID=252967 RepID=A0A5C1QCF0_9SPIO|nr:nitrogenase molybdenum-iron protein subunit beta [Thiospirochaeta perfilievii]QEN04599.1 nitrogenase molybdenum-iron protein subunit beta [Thiospirochaeta perfilievii]